MIYTTTTQGAPLQPWADGRYLTRAAQHRIVVASAEISGCESMVDVVAVWSGVALAVEAAAFKTDYVVERGSVLKFTGHARSC